MTKKLEETFNLPSIEELSEEAAVPTKEESEQAMVSIEDAITISEKINTALSEVDGMEEHDDEMDDLAQKAIESYEELMRLGMNISDMAAGKVFDNAAAMLKLALEAKDSKVNRKLKQVDLMLKKARLDQGTRKGAPTEEEQKDQYVFDRNELLRQMSEKNEGNDK